MSLGQQAFTSLNHYRFYMLTPQIGTYQTSVQYALEENHTQGPMMNDLKPIDPETPELFGAMLLEHVQLYARSPKPWVFNVEHPIFGTATIGLADGSVVYAKFGPQTGEEAFFAVLCWDRGTIINSQTVEYAHNIDRTLNWLLFNAVAYMDEASDVMFQANVRATQELEYPVQFDETEAETKQELTQNVSQFNYEPIVSKLLEANGLSGFEFFDAQGNSIFRKILSEKHQHVRVPVGLLHALIDVCEEPIEELLFTRGSYHHVLIHKSNNMLNLHIFFAIDETTLGMAKYAVDQVLSS